MIDLVVSGAAIAAVPERVFANPVRAFRPTRKLPSESLTRNISSFDTAEALSIREDEASEI